MAGGKKGDFPEVGGRCVKHRFASKEKTAAGRAFSKE
jgi:hypothetical protein